MTLCVASGVAISRVALPWLGITPAAGPFWSRLHILTAEVTLGLVPVPAALRWRWIARVGRRLLTRGRAGRSGRTGQVSPDGGVRQVTGASRVRRPG